MRASLHVCCRAVCSCEVGGCLCARHPLGRIFMKPNCAPQMFVFVLYEAFLEISIFLSFVAHHREHNGADLPEKSFWDKPIRTEI